MTKTESGRRGNGEGSISAVRTLSNGDTVYRFSIWANSLTEGRKRVKGTHIGRSIQEAKKAMWEKKNEEETKHQSPAAQNFTVTNLLTEWMEKDRKNSGASPRTLQIQKDLIRLHVQPRMGRWLVTALTAGRLDDFHRELLNETELGRSRFQIHVVLNQMLGYAVKRGYLNVNPLLSVKVPRRQEKRKEEVSSLIKAWTPSEAGQLERAALADGNTLSLSIAFGLRTGMRRGEIFGLKWSQVNLDEGSLRIKEVLSTHGKLSRSMTEPKNAPSRRKIMLGQSALKILRLVQERQRLGQKADQPIPEFVFTTRSGEMQHPNNAYRALHRLLDAEQLPRLPFHSLRHTFVSIAAHQGWSIKQVSVYIGHANTLVTQTTYLHLWPEDQEAIEFDLAEPDNKSLEEEE